MPERYWVNTLDDSADVAGPDWALERAINVAKICLARASPRSREAGDYKAYTGAPGMAYMCMRLAAMNGIEHDAKLLFLRMGHEYLQADSLPENRRSLGQIGPSLLCGHAGHHFITALFGKCSAADSSISSSAIQAYLELSSFAADPRFDADEFLYGRAGYLYGLVSLHKEFGESVISLDVISSVAKAVVESGRNYVKEGRLHRRGRLPPMFWEWHSRHYLGTAHGALGILHSLLICPSTLWTPEDGVISDMTATLDFILTLWLPLDSNYPVHLESDSKDLVHWCHGATGAVFTFIEAYSLLGHERYLEAAVLAGETVWERGLLNKGPGLCHGVSGNSYAFLALYRVTHDAKYLRRAHRFAEFMGGSDFAQVALNPDHPYSLFEGLSGAACLYADLVHPEDSRFPMFEL